MEIGSPVRRRTPASSRNEEEAAATDNLMYRCWTHVSLSHREGDPLRAPTRGRRTTLVERRLPCGYDVNCSNVLSEATGEAN